MEFICKYCGKECKNSNSLHNHERLCKLNPNRDESSFVKYNKSGHAPANQYIKAAQLGLPKPELSDEARKKLSEATTRNNLARSKEFNEKISKTCLAKSKAGEWHVSLAKNLHTNYNGVDLHGSWELAYAQYLDANNIEWQRCKDRFEYIFEGKLHYYTPDFYLVTENAYVEIKGYRTKKDLAKWSQFPQDKKLVVLKQKDLQALGITIKV